MSNFTTTLMNFTKESQVILNNWAEFKNWDGFVECSEASEEDLKHTLNLIFTGKYLLTLADVVETCRFENGLPELDRAEVTYGELCDELQSGKLNELYTSELVEMTMGFACFEEWEHFLNVAFDAIQCNKEDEFRALAGEVVSYLYDAYSLDEEFA